MRDELLNESLFIDLDQARQMIGDWVTDYNIARPHSSLGYKTPTAYRAEGRNMAEVLTAVGHVEPKARTQSHSLLKLRMQLITSPRRAFSSQSNKRTGNSSNNRRCNSAKCKHRSTPHQFLRAAGSFVEQCCLQILLRVWASKGF